MYNKYQQGGVMPPQQQGGGLPPELQQILNSLPEDVKQYIMSLPLEQQIQELSRIAQGQMQAVQQSPNQMMQRGMNQPPQGQPMMKMGGRFQTGSKIGVNSIDNKPLEQPIGNVIPNYNYNTTPMAPKYSPGPQPPVKKGEVMRINGKDRTIVSTTINGKEFVGYIDDNGVFKPINIGITTPGNTAPQGGVNTGSYDFNPPAKISPVPAPPKKTAPPKRVIPTIPPKTDVPTDRLPGPRSYDPNPEEGYPAGKVPNPNPRYPASPHGWDGVDGLGIGTNPGWKGNTRPGIGSNLSPTPNWGLPNNKSNDKSNKVSPNNSSQLQGPDKGYTTHEGYQSGKKQNNNTAQQKLNDEYNSLKAKQKNGTISGPELGRLKHMEATGVKVGSTIPATETKNYQHRGQLQQQYTVTKQYGGLLYADGGTIDTDDLDYQGYRRENRYSARNRRQEQRNQRRLVKLQRKEDRLNPGSARWRMNQNRQARVLGRENINEHQKNVGAYNRDVIANEIGQKSGIAMTPAKAPQTISPRTPSNITPAPPAVITPVPKPNVGPSPTVTPTPNKGGKKGLSDFEKAFAAARKAHGGPGGRFWWTDEHGVTREYTTDWAEEVGKNKPNSGGGSTAQAPTNPNTPATPAAPTTGGQPVQSKWRKIAGDLGGDLAKLASYLDLGTYTGALARKLGASESTVKAAEWAGSIGQLFIPGLGVAGAVGRAGKIAKIAKAVDAANDVAKGAKNAKKLITYGPRAGEFLSSLATKAGNTAKYIGNASKVAPGARTIGEAGVAYGEGRDSDAARDAIIGGVLTAVGAGSAVKGVRGLNKTKIAQQELGEYANVANKGLHKRVLDSKTGEYMWKKVSPGTVGDDILKKAKDAGIPNPRFKNYTNPGTYMDDLGNMYDETGKLIKKATSGIKSKGKAAIDKIKKMREKKPETVVENPPVTPKYGGLLYKSGGKISKNKGMKVMTCKYGCH